MYRHFHCSTSCLLEQDHFPGTCRQTKARLDKKRKKTIRKRPAGRNQPFCPVFDGFQLKFEFMPVEQQKIQAKSSKDRTSQASSLLQSASNQIESYECFERAVAGSLSRSTKAALLAQTLKDLMTSSVACSSAALA